MPPFTSKSKREKRDERRRRARSTPAHAPPLSTLPPAPPRHPRRGVTLTEVTRSGRKVIPSAKAIEENGMSTQTHTQPTQPTQEATDSFFQTEEWEEFPGDQQVIEDDGGLFEDLTKMTP